MSQIAGGDSPGQGRWVLVTGCSSGIGRATAQLLRDEGFRVIATARRDEDMIELRDEGFSVLPLELADPVSVELCAGKALSIAGGDLWGLVNNAAFALPGAVEDLSRDALKRQFETNLFGTHQLTVSILPSMLERARGRIVNVSSVLGLVSMPWRGAYAASKFALEGLTQTLRMELEGTGVDTVLVEPGPIETRFRLNAQTEFDRDVDPTASRHAAQYERMRAARADPEGKLRFSVPSARVAEVIAKALTAGRPRLHYMVTWPTWALEIARRLLPRRWLDPILRGRGT
jgi:NAD(P)-dependent dehydrogenase (short-subunit alcohol dehydrogenase family)